ncbi:helix-turn-helix domain-containing protein [Deinococcus sp. QL22]|uniref:helix-turn-helix domain-containing protein n=1 Tax=Deinococcus sp. QL22 TaxID=2939437 RepID=UPI002017A2B7|nr:helix-turn-helix transcriptional regulator [Deinococcus sp. QL22]UQN10649.1 helix-turn-helix domain-containing protein [Deinococcus sp. QL22]
MPKTNQPASPLRAVFGANLRATRKAKGLSIFDIAHDSKIDWSYISQIERGQRNSGLDMLDALAQAVGVRVVDLLDPETEAVHAGTEAPDET